MSSKIDPLIRDILFIIGPCQYGSESNSFFPRDFFTENWLKNLSYWEMNEKLLWDVMWEFDTRIEKKRGNEDTFHIKKHCRDPPISTNRLLFAYDASHDLSKKKKN